MATVTCYMYETIPKGCSSWVESHEPGRPDTLLGKGSISRPGARLSHMLPYFFELVHPSCLQGWCLLVPSRNSKALAAVARQLSKYTVDAHLREGLQCC